MTTPTDENRDAALHVAARIIQRMDEKHPTVMASKAGRFAIELRDVLDSIIARALMEARLAERTRCAGIARDYVPHGTYEAVQQGIAAAIMEE